MTSETVKVVRYGGVRAGGSQPEGFAPRPASLSSNRIDVTVGNSIEAQAAGLLPEQTRPLDWWHRPKGELMWKIAEWYQQWPVGRQLDQSAELDVVGRLLAELLSTPVLWLSYSRRKEAYARWSGYVPPSVTCNRVVRLVDRLRDAGLVAHCKGYRKRSGDGFQSKLKALPALLELFPPAVAAETEADPKAPLVIVKDEKGEHCQPADMALFHAKCRKVGRLRDFMRSFIVEAPAQPGRMELRQVFNSAHLDHGGRYYGWWQNLSKQQRLAILLDGQPVVELDYSQNHPSILYHSLGLSVPENAYLVDGVPREIVKATFGRMLNSKNQGGTRRKLAEELGSAYLADRIVSTLLEIHAPLAAAGKFWSGIGHELMNQDAGVAKLVLTDAMWRSIPMLPVHDSFIVQAEHAEHVQQMMEHAYHGHYGVTPVVKTSRPAP